MLAMHHGPCDETVCVESLKMSMRLSATSNDKHLFGEKSAKQQGA
jgi:hypothetical protein